MAKSVFEIFESSLNHVISFVYRLYYIIVIIVIIVQIPEVFKF